MKQAICALQSVTPYSQSKNVDREQYPKKPRETDPAYEFRMWKSRMHINKAGFVEIPTTSFEGAIREAVKRLQIQVPGKGKCLFTKPFEAGFAVLTSITTNTLAETVAYDRLFVPSDGKPGGGRRVWKYFPRIDQWSGAIHCVIYDDLITRDVFVKAIESAGLLVGIGRFRPQNRGFYGRFKVDSVDWSEV